MEKYEIWCKSTMQTEARMFYCMSIYRKWDEEDIPFKRRAKRIFKLYKEKNAKDYRTFYLLEE